MNPIPVVVITGSLGAGKTTLINNLLRSEDVARLRPALLINEFGKVGVDRLLLDDGRFDAYEINRGSLFCSCTQHQLISVLQRIADGEHPGLLIIESTGMAEVCDLGEVLALPHLAGSYAFCGTVCVVDARRFVTTSAFVRAARQQVASSDVVVVNKVDDVQVPELDALGHVLRRCNSEAPIMRTSRGVIDAGVVLGITRIAPSGAMSNCAPEAVAAWSCEGDVVFEHDVFRGIISDLGWRLLRFKGDVSFTDGRRRFVEVVCGDAVEREPVQGDACGSRFTAICFDMKRDEVERWFMSAVARVQPAGA